MARLGAGAGHGYVAVFLTGDGGRNWQRVLDPLRTRPDALPEDRPGVHFPAGRLADRRLPGAAAFLFLYVTARWRPGLASRNTARAGRTSLLICSRAAQRAAA